MISLFMKERPETANEQSYGCDITAGLVYCAFYSVGYRKSCNWKGPDS